jgi:hypothetical protein
MSNSWSIQVQSEQAQNLSGTDTFTLPTITATAGDYLWVMATSLYNGQNFTVTGNGNTFTNMITFPATIGQYCTQGFFVPSCNAGPTTVSISNTSPILSAGVWDLTMGPNGTGTNSDITNAGLWTTQFNSSAIRAQFYAGGVVLWQMFCSGGSDLFSWTPYVA